MRTFEQVLVDLDSGVGSMLSRIALGLAIVPAFRALSGDQHGAWLFVAMFVGLLVALRVIPAVLRHALPFSAEAKSIWSARRQIAKRHDAYQWQKLFWIGLGLSLHAALTGSLESGELFVTLTCLIGGGAGLWLWRRNKAILVPQ
jgi:hypothetical protein